MLHALTRNFLGHAPVWYKLAVVGLLAVNPVLLYLAGPTVAGWCVVAEFIFILAMTLKCYPLQPGGLLAIEAAMLGLTDAASIFRETVGALPAILLLLFMVSAIYFLKDLLLFAFSKLLLNLRSQTGLALVFCASAALLSAFLDALAVIAVVMTVGAAFYQVYHRFASGKHFDAEHDWSADTHVHERHQSDLEQFRAFLRGLLMHAAVGTALGGLATRIAEPQNLSIANQADWGFAEYFLRMWPVSIPVLVVGLLLCVALDRLRWFGYGTPLPPAVRSVIEDYHLTERAKHSAREQAVLWVQGAAVAVLIAALGFHVAEVGLIGLAVLIVVTAFMGVTEERRLAKAFEIALPFGALLVVSFAVAAVIRDQHLFQPLIERALALSGSDRVAMLYLVNGALSAICDNVFVATMHIQEVKAALLQGAVSQDQFEHLAVTVGAATNIWSIATPNGQMALLFLLTSAVAPLVRLSYGRMLWMALPYTIALSLTGLLAVVYLV
jgi:NhaB family Na+:H+ antiporter